MKDIPDKMSWYFLHLFGISDFPFLKKVLSDLGVRASVSHALPGAPAARPSVSPLPRAASPAVSFSSRPTRNTFTPRISPRFCDVALQCLPETSLRAENGALGWDKWPVCSVRGSVCICQSWSLLLYCMVISLSYLNNWSWKFWNREKWII